MVGRRISDKVVIVHYEGVLDFKSENGVLVLPPKALNEKVLQPTPSSIA